MSDPTDPVIRSALDEVQVPDYTPGFWDRLDDRLERDVAPGRSPDADDDLEPDDQTATWIARPGVERPSGRTTSRQGRTRLAVLAAAAAAVLVFLVTQAPVDDSGVRTASPPEGTPSTDATVAPVPSPSAPEVAVLRWLEAIGAGDVDEAVDLTGPRTVAYYEALGADMAGVVMEMGEGYGGWVDAADRSTRVVPLGAVDGSPVAVVVVSGTWTGEGEDGFRSDAIPAVQDADGEWRVEHAAFDPDRGGRLELTSSPPGESGLGAIAPDGVIEVSSAGLGNYHFAVDGADPTAVPATPAGSPVRFDPPGALSLGSHVLFVAQLDDRTITAQVLTFTVE